MAIRTRIASEAIRTAMGLGRALPRSVALRLFTVGGALFQMAERGGSARTRRNLRLVYGDVEEADRIAGRVYRELGRNAVDLARLDRRGDEDPREIVEFAGIERVDEALRLGRGVIGVTAHLGNWELLSACLGRRGIPLTVLASSLFDPRLDKRLVRLRERHGVHSLFRSDPGWAREAMRVLYRGEMIGLLMDLRSGSGGVETRFLGRPALTVAGPVRLAAASGATVLPMACWRVNGDRYRIEVDRPLVFPRRRPVGTELAEWTEGCSRALEAYILRAPAQWVWMHDRWGMENA
ncbi:MAG: lysophospholipid acyltransferase family protein [Candidatus Eisenbacteria bacterium]|nr:lysophospholipid acyltransferase family protein [Candidatus Eisenbacteria bacterium]